MDGCGPACKAHIEKHFDDFLWHAKSKVKLMLEEWVEQTVEQKLFDVLNDHSATFRTSTVGGREGGGGAGTSSYSAPASSSSQYQPPLGRVPGSHHQQPAAFGGGYYQPAEMQYGPRECGGYYQHQQQQQPHPSPFNTAVNGSCIQYPASGSNNNSNGAQQFPSQQSELQPGGVEWDLSQYLEQENGTQRQ